MPHAADAAGAVRHQNVPFQLERGAATGGARAASRPTALRFAAFGHRFDLSLAENDTLVAPGVQAYIVDDAGRHTAPMPAMWIATGSDGSTGRLSIDGSRVKGWVRTASETYVFEPSSTATDASLTVSTASDLLAAADPILCGTDAIAPGVTVSPTLRSQRSVTKPLVMELSVVADAAFYRHHGDQSVPDILSIINGVDGVFRNDLQLTLQIVQVVVYRTDASQPFSTATDPADLLSVLAHARQTDPILSVGHGDVTHLLTGQNFGSAAGISYVGSVCNNRDGASLTTPDQTSSYLDTILVAHELGHNLGADHDGPSGQFCKDTPNGYIMWPVLFGSALQQFSPCSIGTIDATVATASCLDSGVPTGCGNGVVDPGEDCDAGPSAIGTCCRVDCKWAAAGLPCGDSGDVCLDAVCNGAGTCANVPNTAACPSPDACVLAQCSAGSCDSTGVDRAFESVESEFHLDGNGSVVSAKITATAPIDFAGSTPCDAGMQIQVAVSGMPQWDETIDPSLWICKSNGKSSYRSAAPMAGHVRGARVSYDLTHSRVTMKLKLAAPNATFTPAKPTVFLLSGDHVDGQCGTNTAATCATTGASYICQ